MMMEKQKNGMNYHLPLEKIDKMSSKAENLKISPPLSSIIGKVRGIVKQREENQKKSCIIFLRWDGKPKISTEVENLKFINKYYPSLGRMVEIISRRERTKKSNMSFSLIGRKSYLMQFVVSTQKKLKSFIFLLRANVDKGLRASYIWINRIVIIINGKTKKYPNHFFTFELIEG